MPCGNEWIQYNQFYYKIPVASDGIYRISIKTLDSVGFNITAGSITTAALQLFNKGVQQYLYLQGGTNGYIEFYGKHNDAAFDSALYTGINYLPNPYYSLFNDTATYFLTWSNTTTSNNRMTISLDTAYSNYAGSAQSYFMNNAVLTGTSYYGGATYQSGVEMTDPQYTQAEGYFLSGPSQGQTTTYNLPTKNVYSGTGAPLAGGHFIIVGSSQEGCSSCNDHDILTSYPGNNPGWDTAFYGYASIRHYFSCPPAQLTQTTTPFTFTSNTDVPSDSPGSIAIAYIQMKYPHTNDLEGATTFKMCIPNSFQPYSYYNFTDFSTTGPTDTVRLYDLTNNVRISVTSSTSGYKALIPNPIASGEKLCYITSDAQIQKVYAKSFQPVGPHKNALFTNFAGTYATADSAYLIVTHSSLMSAVTGTSSTTYQGYRSSPAGGSNVTVVADVDELYDQFAYGIHKHPLAIRNFAQLALNKFHSPPHNLFLIGKSIHPTYGRFGGTNYTDNLVPSIGNPPCDVLFTTWLNSTIMAPTIPTGRISAKTTTDVAVYLNKVIEHESSTQDSTGWQKRVLHFAGGVSGAENATFLGYTNTWADTISAPKFGASVSTFSKNTTAPISINTSDSLQNLINGGVALMTFLGHSAGSGWDVGVDAPNTFSNKGKYPLILSNGCYAGDVNIDYTNINNSTNSEIWTFIPELGSIGFIASVSTNLDNVLETYTSSMYYNLSFNLYGQSIGNQIKATFAQNQNLFGDLSYKSGFLAMCLEGDPAIHLYKQTLPDYVMLTHNIAFDTKTSSSYFRVIVTEINTGLAVNQKYAVQLTRTLPSGQTQTYVRYKTAPFNTDTVAFLIPYNPSIDPGLNQFKVTLNAYKSITESNYSNNAANAELNIAGTTITPVYPYNYAIIPSTNVRLKASTVNPFNQHLIKYTFQLDTTDTYNSNAGGPIAQTTITSKGGVVEWSPTLLKTNKDSIVYFWRVTADTTWHESSFQVIKGKRGFSQAQIFQFKNNKFQYLNLNRAQRQFQFVNNQISVHAQTGLYGNNGNVTGFLGGIPEFFGYPQYSLNAVQEASWFCTTFSNGQYVFAVINPITGQPWLNQSPSNNSVGLYNSMYCTDPVVANFEYAIGTGQNDPAQVINFINNVPTGYYVLCYTTNCHYDTMPGNPSDVIYPAFTAIGSAQIQQVPENLPYIIWGRKGASVGSATEIVGTSPTAEITFDASITTNWTVGEITSPIIGPALTWDSLYWSASEIYKGTDSIRLGIIGIKNDGTIDTLVGSVTKNIPGLSRSQKKVALSNYINAKTYPTMQLIYYATDNAHPIPPQLKRWQVIYTQVPELAINPQAPLAVDTLHSTNIQEGDTIKFIYPVQNISEFNFSPNLVYSSWVVDAKGYPHILPDRIKYAPLTAGKLIQDTVKFPTLGYTGLNQLWVAVNELGKSQTQLEQYHFNNIANLTFNVLPDKVNPLLDVTFDGIHILNQDIVSPSPTILIKLTDENKFLALNDPSNFKVFIQGPSNSSPVLIPFGSNLSFTPAVLPANSCKLVYTPTFTQDGTYQLLVQATDRSGNASGATYQIQFEVITESSITQLMNYPNPFSTSTRFVFTLTGSSVPDQMLIRIMTITGKVVKEITKEELGPIHIGRNITDYAWDGRDQYGNLVGVGVYLYHVETKLNGHTLQTLSSGADQYITKGFGKMYLIR